MTWQAPDLVDAINYALSKDAVVVASAGNVEQGDREVMRARQHSRRHRRLRLRQAGRLLRRLGAGPGDSHRRPDGEHHRAGAQGGLAERLHGGQRHQFRSSAIISGVVALIRSKYPNLDAANVINRLIKTARDAGPAGRDPQFGFGAVDPIAALTRSVPPVAANPLLEGAAASPTRPGGAARPGDDDNGPAVEFGVSNKAGAIVQLGLCLAVPIIALIVLVVVLRRRKRRPAVIGPYPGPPGTPPPGWPAGQPTPPGYGPPPQHVPGYGPRPGQPAPGHPPVPAAPAPPPGTPGWPGPGQAAPPNGPHQ